jgi:hypothetical protein
LAFKRENRASIQFIAIVMGVGYVKAASQFHGKVVIRESDAFDA